MLIRHLDSENDKVNHLKAISKYLFILLKSLRKLPRYNKGVLYRSSIYNDIKEKKKETILYSKAFFQFLHQKIWL